MFLAKFIVVLFLGIVLKFQSLTTGFSFSKLTSLKADFIPSPDLDPALAPDPVPDQNFLVQDQVLGQGQASAVSSAERGRIKIRKKKLS